MKINISGTKFLNRETDIKHKDVLIIESEGVWNDSTRFKKDDGTPASQFDINLRLSNGEIRSTSLTWGNIQLLVQAFGDETTNWVGKEVRAWKTKSDRAKNGYTFVFVPTDWNRDETGEWDIPDHYNQDPVGGESTPAGDDDIDLDGPAY